jgi:hypothetical protein
MASASGSLDRVVQVDRAFPRERVSPDARRIRDPPDQVDPEAETQAPERLVEVAQGVFDHRRVDSIRAN